ncbi:MAG: L,D-transpeptidase family protein [Aquihabitans sp.]
MGSVGTRSKALQQALSDQRYDAGAPDGKFGTKTTLAVWAYQALHGLPRDGIVTPELEAVIVARVPQEMLRPELGPTHTEIDLTRQVLIVWRDGAPVLITHVSSGSQKAYCEKTKVGRHCGSANTPLGIYQYGRRVPGWREAPLGRLYNPVYFNGGIAVHGAGSVPNHPASHGCVRIPMSIAEYFPTLVNTGETVEVFRS